MLLSKQWSRVVGGVLAIAVFLLIFNFLDTKPYTDYWKAKTSSASTTAQAQSLLKLPYRPQDEDHEREHKLPEQSQEDRIADLTGSQEHKLPYRPQTEEQDVGKDFEEKADAIKGIGSTNAHPQAPPSYEPGLDLPYRPQAEQQEGSPGHDATAKVEQYKSRTTTAAPSHAAGLPPAELLTATSTANVSATSAISPTSTAFRKAVVMGKTTEEDTDWVKQNLPDWEAAIYAVDLEANVTSPTGFRTKINKARETMPYLTYMAENYDDFPDVAVFIHAHRKGYPKAWHNDAKGYDVVNMLNELRLDEVQRRGYANLRCIDFPGCPDEVQLNRKDHKKETDTRYPEVYGAFFNMTVEEVREQIPIIATPCCAQFAISKQQLHRRPKSEYERFIKVITENRIDDHTLGTIMEYMWHLMFYQDAIYCDDTAHCWKTLYGRPDGWTNEESSVKSLESV